MSPRFEVSDKVVLCPEFGEFASPTVPALVPGRVYCVERVNCLQGNWWVQLVGVREHRVKCRDTRGVSTLCLRRVGPMETGRAWEEAA